MIPYLHERSVEKRNVGRKIYLHKPVCVILLKTIIFRTKKTYDILHADFSYYRKTNYL